MVIPIRLIVSGVSQPPIRAVRGSPGTGGGGWKGGLGGGLGFGYPNPNSNRNTVHSLLSTDFTVHGIVGAPTATC